LAKTGLQFASAATSKENIAPSLALATPLAPLAEAYFAFQMGKISAQSLKETYDLMREHGPVDEQWKQRVSDALINTGVGAVGAAELGVKSGKGAIGRLRGTPEAAEIPPEQPAPPKVEPPVSPEPPATPLPAAAVEFNEAQKAAEPTPPNSVSRLRAQLGLTEEEARQAIQSPNSEKFIRSMLEKRGYKQGVGMHEENFLQAVSEGSALIDRIKAESKPAEPTPLPAEVQAAEQAAAAAPTPPLKPADLEPALLVDGKPITGGEDHDAIFNKALEQPNLSEEQTAALFKAQGRDADHVFVDKAGKVYTREQAAKALGEEKPLQSERLGELQKPAAPTAAPATATPEPPTVEFDIDAGIGESLDDISARFADLNESGAYAVRRKNKDGEWVFDRYLPDGTKLKGVAFSLEHAARDINDALGSEQGRGAISSSSQKAKAEQAAMMESEKGKFAAGIKEGMREARQPTTPEPTWLEKPLSYWDKFKTAEDLPKGADRASLAKSFGVSNQPSKILAHIKKRVAEIRAKPPTPPAVEVAPKPVETANVPQNVPQAETAPPQAAAKAQAEVSKVAAVEGQRPAKEVKSELVSRIEQSIEAAPTDEQAYKAAIEKAGAKVSLNADNYEKQKEDIRKGNQIPKVTIDIPGDGTFNILNTKEALGEVLERAKKLSTQPGATVKVSKSGIPKADKEWIAEQLKAGQEPVGMGGAALGEVQATGPRGEPVHGIAARVTEQRRQQGVIAPVEPGEGIAPEESVAHGRQLIAQGANPQAVLDEFNRTKAVSADAMAIVRAHGERLTRTAYAMADAHGIYSPEYEAAWEADSNWTKAIKPMQTEWHKIGQAQQGEVEVDTGTFHGLRKAFQDATGKDFSKKQAAEAEEIVKAVQKATKEADKGIKDAFEKLDKSVKDTKPEVTKPGDMAKPGVDTVWKRAKEMIDEGETDFTTIRHQLAIEFGLPVEEVTRILAKPKGAKRITDEMYTKLASKRRFQNEAKAWIKNQQVPGWLRFARSVPRAFFAAKVFGHGTVGMITHAGLNIFNPGAWRTYWPNFFRQYKLLVNPGYHERMMQDLLRDPLYTKARRAGLINDPYKYQDDYQTPQLTKWLSKMGLLGTRGFDSLKLFRQARFNQIWNSMPDNVKTPQYASILADSVNHATGAVNMRFREWANVTFFAPKLESSRWAWMVKDPLIAAKTFVDWRNSTPEARAFAMSELKQKAAIAGTYYSLLAINQGLLSASSNQKINFTDPHRGDFLAFKAAGRNIGIVGPMIGMVRLFANLYHAAAGKRGKLENLTPRYGEMGEIGAEYARGKLSPFMSFGADVVSQADFQGRPMPYSSDKVPPYLKRQGIGRYTYGQYAAGQLTPIPVSEAVREVWHDQGMNDSQIDAYLRALLVGAVAGGTGARVSVDNPPKPVKK
jgi:hypothetical protein